MSENTVGRGFIERQHHRIRFTDLDELFIARMLLNKFPDAAAGNSIKTTFSLLDFFPRFGTLTTLEQQLVDTAFDISPRIVEISADFISMLTGSPILSGSKRQSAFAFYNQHIESRLKILRVGDPIGSASPNIIEHYEKNTTQRLHSYEITARPAYLATALAKDLRQRLELQGDLVRRALKRGLAPAADLRIDYRKELDFLVDMLDEGLRLTGEREFAFLSTDFTFRHALLVSGSGESQFTMPTPGTASPETKILLPLLLEVNGLLDVLNLDLMSDPHVYDHVVVLYFVGKPAQRNLFAATTQGLTPNLRSRMSESELVLYDRVHQMLARAFVFGGRPTLEVAFAELTQWLLRKVSYCLEEPSFLKDPAVAWLGSHTAGTPIRMEDDFFLPFVYERLKDEFGSRVVKKPKQFGGEIDILFASAIPIELKVRREQREVVR